MEVRVNMTSRYYGTPGHVRKVWYFAHLNTIAEEGHSTAFYYSTSPLVWGCRTVSYVVLTQMEWSCFINVPPSLALSTSENVSNDFEPLSDEDDTEL
ncbi:hypothetical protein NPIL_443081 [Nephila pilipes]|uniref:Uncharacterized protein n=1 Tax=Nephila pilipes TaxID=299642 RepID=A0A8X6NN77_NEPPI|nr:hypothetical protein NPIL_443081 [Nephila pilipes]